MISGYFSKKSQGPKGEALHTLLVEYLLASFFVCSAKSLLSGELVGCNLLSPPFGTWYLMALFLLKCIYPWVTGVKHCIIVSMLFAIFVGCIDRIGSFLTLSRTVCLLPFFLIGAVFLKRSKIEELRSLLMYKKVLLISGWVLIFVSFLYVMQKNSMNYEIVWLKASYHNSDMSWKQGALARMILFISALSSGIVIFMTMTQRRCFLTQWGTNSLPIYVLHLAAYYPIKRVIDLCPYKNIWFLCGLTIAITFAVVCFLSTNCVSWLFRKIVALIKTNTWRENQYE